MKYVVSKANEGLSDEYQIRILSYDRAGWDADLFHWLEDEQGITPVTWVKRTAPNVKLLNGVSNDEFQPIEQERTVGKGGKHKKDGEYKVENVADTTIDFPALGSKRVVIMETKNKRRIGIYTTASSAKEWKLINLYINDPQVTQIVHSRNTEIVIPACF